jgi:hypothetical protein
MSEIPNEWLNPDWRKPEAVKGWCKTYDAIEMMGHRLVRSAWRGYLAEPDTAHARRIAEVLHHWLREGKLRYRLTHNYRAAEQWGTPPDAEPGLWDPAMGMETNLQASTMGPASLKMSQLPYEEDGSGLRYAVSIDRGNVQRLLAAIDRPRGAPEGTLAKRVRKALQAGAKPTPAPVRAWFDKHAGREVRVHPSDPKRHIVIGDEVWTRAAFESAVRRVAERMGLR